MNLDYGLQRKAKEYEDQVAAGANYAQQMDSNCQDIAVKSYA